MRPTSHAPTIRRWFGLDFDPPGELSPVRPTLPTIRPGQIVLITGPSGSGKTRLMRRLLRCRRILDPSFVRIHLRPGRLPDRPVIDCLSPLDLHDTLRMLSRCGLADARDYLRRPRELSAGQRWRLRLAMALARADASAARGRPVLLIADEFAAMLDRITACVIARSLRRIVDADRRLAALCITSHDDLLGPLAPDLLITCDFGRIEWAVGRTNLRPVGAWLMSNPPIHKPRANGS